jgi:hypothetical protein
MLLFSSGFYIPYLLFDYDCLQFNRAGDEAQRRRWTFYEAVKTLLIRGYGNMQEKRKFPRFAITNRVICFRYGRQMIMRTLNISLGGLKLEANFDLGVGESMDLAILTKNTRIHCKGMVLAIEEFRDRVHARLRFARISDVDFKKLSDYLHNLYWGGLQKWVISGIVILSAYIVYVLIRTYFSQ